MKRRFQKRIPGGRQPLPATVLKQIHKGVERDAARHNVSKSFVIAVILAAHYRIKEQEQI